MNFVIKKIKIVHIVSVAHSWCDHAIGVTLKVMLNSKEKTQVNKHSRVAHWMHPFSCRLQHQSGALIQLTIF